MPRIVVESRIDSKSAREGLDARDKPYKRSVGEGVHLGYRKAAKGPGKWVEFVYGGRSGAYKTETFATADDGLEANGVDVLSFEQARAAVILRAAGRQRNIKRLTQAEARAEERQATGLTVRSGPYTVNDAMSDYLHDLERGGQKDAAYRVRIEVKNWIAPYLGTIVCAPGKLTTAKLDAWLDHIASTPANETRQRAWTQKNTTLLQQIRDVIQAEAPFRPGYQRVGQRLRALGIHAGPQRVRRVMRDNDLLSRRRPDEVAAALELQKQGLGVTAIGDRIGRTPKTVRSYLNRGVAPPHPVYRKPSKPVPAVEIDDPIVMQRKRRKTASGTQAYLLAALNAAWRRGDIDSETRDAWKRMKKFKGVTVGKVDYLRKEEVVRLVKSAEPPEFRDLIQGNLHCGARISEVRRMRVRDFNPDAGLLRVVYSKTDRAANKGGRDIRLSPQGIRFFGSMTAGRDRNELIFRQPDGSAWKADNQYLLKLAAKRAKLGRHISMGIFRHTWASERVMAGASLSWVAKQMGHTTTQMVELHYATLADDWQAEMARQYGSNYDLPERNVVGLDR